MVQQTIKHNKTHLTLTQNSAQQAKEQQNTRNDRVTVIPPDRNRPSRGIYTILHNNVLRDSVEPTEQRDDDDVTLFCAISREFARIAR